MRIVGHGLDIVDTARIKQLLDRHGDRFVSRCFTPNEAAYALPLRRRVEHLAGRFAAKEAILKALGTGLAHGICWTDVETLRLPSGQPTVALHGRCKDIAAELGITQWSLSITHVRDIAAASALALATD